MTNGKKVLIIATGSRGDVAPPAGVGARLCKAGYDVTMAADKGFAELVEDAGMTLRPTIGDMRSAAKSELINNVSRDGAFSRSGVKILKLLKQFFGMMNADIARITAETDPAIVLVNPWGSAAYHVAEALGIPSIGMHLQPQQPTGELPPIVFGRSLGKVGNRVAYGVLRKLERTYFTGINDIRAEHGLPPTTMSATYRKQAAEYWPILHGFSSYVVPRPRDWRPGLDVTGYWWPPMPTDWTPPGGLRRFLDDGPPPVFVGLGSSNPGDVENLSRTVTAALRKAGRRGIIQAGWAELSASDDDMLTIGDVPHQWLFPRMAAVVHAAGAGTTAAGLRAGVPAVPIPVTGDGPFWSSRLAALGVTPGAIRFKKLTVDGLADAVREAVTNPVYKQHAVEVTDRIRSEDGAAQVLDSVKNLT
ncbi:MAG TPA: glycosyltransferase [Pseudonocardiaceae bacterium]|nr:glycosyltransferase [Pseudonocardiaceae bacterium]